MRFTSCQVDEIKICPPVMMMGESNPACKNNKAPRPCCLPAAARIISTVLAVLLLWAAPAAAVQGHGGPEGLYGHQLAHIFFVISMGLLVFWLRKWQLDQQAGWGHIQKAALFFILWNLDAFVAHMMVEQIKAVDVVKQSTWQVMIITDPPSRLLAWTYYVIKLDHLLCVPAMFYLFRGLKLLARAAAGSKPSREAP